jgi:hypothetical protein
MREQQRQERLEIAVERLLPWAVIIGGHGCSPFELAAVHAVAEFYDKLRFPSISLLGRPWRDSGLARKG